MDRRSATRWILGMCVTLGIGFQAGCTDPAGRVDRPALEAGRGQATAQDPAFGIWLWYLEGTGYSSHAALARDLAAMGVKRIYVKVADGAHDPGTWPEVDDTGLVQAYQQQGIEAWAWSYNYPNDAYRQADALYYAARAGYRGYVLDVETEFDGATTTLRALLAEMVQARRDAVSNGHISSAEDLPLYATTWGNPADHGMRVDIIDQYVDGHMPQTYLENWGSGYLADPARWVALGTQEYRDLGANKPVHHIVSAELGRISAAQIDAFFAAAGPESSLWRVPGGGTPASIWDTLRAVNWDGGSGAPAQGSLSLKLPAPIVVGQGVRFSGTASGDIETVQASCDGWPIGAAQVQADGRFGFDYTFSGAGQGRGLVVQGLGAGGVVLDEVRASIDVLAEAPNERIALEAPGQAVVGQVARFAGSASPGIARVLVSVDGWQIADAPVAEGAFAFDYTFSSAGLGRVVLARGLDPAGTERVCAEVSIDVIPAAAPYIEGVPYFYQYDNAINPGGSCQNTAMAMVLKFYGAAGETPDEISRYHGTNQAQSVPGFQQVFDSEAAYFGLAVRDQGTTQGSLPQVRELLAQGKPLAVHGYFTSYGHVIVLVGFDGTDYWAHDPAGVWNQKYMGGGYTGDDPQGGRYVRYHKTAVEHAIAPDGLVWMHEPIL